MELQGGQMRLMLGGDKWEAKVDVHDSTRYDSDRRTRDDRTDTRVSVDQGPDHGCFLELRGKKTNKEIQTSTARRTGRHVEDAAIRRRPGSGISKMYRVLSLSGRVPCAS